MKRESTEKKALRCLHRMAFYRPNDAIRIAMEEGGVDVRRLKLEGISEFKRHANGAVEIKFFDRLKALELLLELQGEENRDGSLRSFLSAVEEGTE